jgi:hypothetical protein
MRDIFGTASHRSSFSSWLRVARRAWPIIEMVSWTRWPSSIPKADSQSDLGRPGGGACDQPFHKPQISCRLWQKSHPRASMCAQSVPDEQRVFLYSLAKDVSCCKCQLSMVLADIGYSVSLHDSLIPLVYHSHTCHCTSTCRDSPHLSSASAGPYAGTF